MLYFSQFRVLEYLFSQFITRGEIGRRATRSSQMLNFPLFKSASGQRTFYYRIVSIWNSMDSHLKTFESVSAFKFNVKRKLIKDFIDSSMFLSCHLNFSVNIFITAFKYKFLN